ncbi:hypothetical protein ACOME3_003544 [Neoechinorhynchus agilis]
MNFWLLVAATFLFSGSMSNSIGSSSLSEEMLTPFRAFRSINMMMDDMPEGAIEDYEMEHMKMHRIRNFFEMLAQVSSLDNCEIFTRRRSLLFKCKDLMYFGMNYDLNMMFNGFSMQNLDPSNPERTFNVKVCLQDRNWMKDSVDESM